MSSSDAVRGPAHSARRTAATSGARPRVPSSRLDDLHLDSGGEVRPSDSASNAPHRRHLSESHKAGSSQRISRERRLERTSITINDSVQIRTRSTTKPSAVEGPSEWPTIPRGNVEADYHEKDHIPTKSEKKVLPLWAPSATIIGHTTAPLAGRISFPIRSSFLPQALEPTPLKQLSSDVQESAVLDDLLFAFMGYEGQYVRFSKGYDPTVEKERLVGPGFEILPGLDPSLQDLSTTMLKMASNYIAVEAFVEVQSREEFGMVNHALCASIRKLLKEYMVLIAQMEYQLTTNASFTLHVLHLHILPTSHMLSQVYTLAQELLRKNSLLEEDLDSIDDFDDVDNILEQLREGGELAPGGMSRKLCKGGSVLRLLTERLSYMSGDPAARELLEGLLRDSSKPYMAMLNEWLHHGGIKDPHSEFLIKEQRSIKRDRLEEDFTDEYWEKRYTIRDDVPPQLEGVKDKVLLAGKYLNVVRECGGVDMSTEMRDVPKSFDDPQFLQNVNSAYAHANSSLLNLLVTTHALPARLRSMKHYFFLDRSDFFSYFLYLSNSELKKQVKEVNVSKLQSLLDLVLRQPGSVAAQDPFKEDVKIHMNAQYLTKFLMGVVNVRGYDQDGNDDYNRTPVAQLVTEDDSKMTGFEALEFKYSVPFPLSLVISSKTVVRYQILFRYLLSMRHLEGLLISSWEDHNKIMTWTHKSGNQKLEMWKRRTWTLRARMLNFVQQFTYYCTSEVIEPNWQILMAKVNGNKNDSNGAQTGEQKVNRTVDELMEDHVDFLDTCLKECMLMNSKLLRIHAKLMSCCTFFAINTSSFSRTLCSADASLAGSAGALAYLATRYPSSRHPIPDHLKTYDPEGLSKMSELLDKYEENFNRHLALLLDALDYYAATETVALGRLCAQLSMTGDKGSGEDGRKHGF
ncbi:hypothetical protein MMC11_001999 [Xylographa trunciseda]|nr:hypothetical protein [Xylographa trunciseda]